MTLQSALALASGRAAGADLLGRLHLAAVATYGWRMAAFVLWRERLPSFQRRRADSDAKLAGMPLSKARGLGRGCWHAGLLACWRAGLLARCCLPPASHEPARARRLCRPALPALSPAPHSPLTCLSPSAATAEAGHVGWCCAPLFGHVCARFLEQRRGRRRRRLGSRHRHLPGELGCRPAAASGCQALYYTDWRRFQAPARPPARWLAGRRACWRCLSHFPPSNPNPVLPQYVGAPLMLGALLWEAVADYQQQMHYERQAASGGPTNK